MATQCTSDAFPLAGLGRRQVVGKFDGGRLSSDGGAVLLRAANQAFQVTGRLAACFIDHRNPARVEHSLESLLGRRVFALALGYEDINDHDRLRDDSLLALALDGPDLTGQSRRRKRDRGHALAGSSTLNRLELGTPQEADEDRYKQVVASAEQIDDLLVDLFLDMHETPPERIVLDVDATDDQLHGQQEGRFYHGYYRHYCYLPLYITCGEHVLCARLRTAQAEAAEGTVAELERIVRRIRQRWPQAAIVVRGDAGFCRDTLMSWCEQRGVDYLLGLARNSRLLGQIRRQLRQAGKACARTGQAARRFRDFRHRTLKSWGRKRRVVGKAEWLPGQRGANPRFVVTSLSREAVAGRQLYEELYCARGEMENRIKEQQLDLFADRTSTATMRANQLRMYSDSLGLRRFLGYELQQNPPDHSTLSRTRRRISLETHEQVFAWVLRRLREAGLADGRTVAVDATMLFANAALRTLRRKDSQAGYREFVEGLAAVAGVPTPTLAELAAFDRKRKGKTLSNKEWESPTDPDARVARMKTGTTHLAHKAEHAVDLESGALVGVTLQAADAGDTATLEVTLEAVEAAQEEGPEQVVADKGYHSDRVLLGLEEAGQEAHIPEPQRAERDFEGKPETERVVKGNRERVASPAGKRLQKLRTEKVERSMAHMYETGGMRRLYLRGRANIRKRLRVHACGFNLGVLMRSVTGIGTPRTLQGQGDQPAAHQIAPGYLPFRGTWSGLLDTIRGLLGLRRGNCPEIAAELA